MRLGAIASVVVSLALLLPGTTSAKTHTSAIGIVETVNKTPYKAWITIYDAGKARHIDYGTLDAYGRRVWRGCCYLFGFPYHVRAEVQKMVDGKERTIFDTTMEIKPDGCVPEDGIEVELRQGIGESFYWESMGCPH